MEKSVKDRVNIEQAIDMVNEIQQKKWLSEFLQRHQAQGSTVVVEEHEANYELIVTRSSNEKGYTGGAEQYFIDKKTGEEKMGWHEHPMQLPESMESEQVKE